MHVIRPAPPILLDASSVAVATTPAALVRTVSAVQDAIVELTRVSGVGTLGMTSEETRSLSMSAGRTLARLLDHLDRDGTLRRIAAAQQRSSRRGASPGRREA